MRTILMRPEDYYERDDRDWEGRDRAAARRPD
jgi:hypothetical protein